VTPAPPAPVATVLLVCTGNVCRSPAAELLLRDRLGTAEVAVLSAGTRALAGHPVHPPMARLLDEAGLAPAAFAARQLTAGLVRTADLVLTMTRTHRSDVAALAPAALRRTLLLGEAAVAAAAARADGWPADVAPTPAARLVALPALAPRYRSPDRAAAVEELADPFQGSERVYRESFAAIEEVVGRLAAAVR
jgi:protein-tyrosine phosphatase